MTELQYPLGPPDWQQYLHVTYADVLAEWRRHTQGRNDIVWSEYGKASYTLPDGLREYPFYRLTSANFEEAARSIVVETGIHANEHGGPLTLVEYGPELFDKALKSGIGVVMYIHTNPSGFDLRKTNPDQRYNAAQERTNNDFLRYEVHKDPGISSETEWTDDLKTRMDYIQWNWVDLSGLRTDIPLETRLLLNDLHCLPKKTVCGVVSLHQDWFPEYHGQQWSYAYPLGDISRYTPVADRVADIVPLLKSVPITSGYGDTDKSTAPVSDEHGFVVRHDGCFADALYRCGAKYAVTVETTRDVPMALVKKVNRLWLDGCLEYVNQL